MLNWADLIAIAFGAGIMAGVAVMVLVQTVREIFEGFKP